ncbi:diguanylate cyclase [Thiomicrorhabdus hydrogeniphila]
MPMYAQLCNVYSNENNQLLESHVDIIQTLIPKSVKEYYKLLMNNPKTALFLTNDLVENHLQNALSMWLKSVLSSKQPDELDELYDQQQHIGQVHARINLDMHLVSEAMIVLKNTLHKGLLECKNTDHRILLIIHNILDAALININQVYFSNHNKIEHQSHLLRNHLSSMSFALEIQQMRNELNEWFMSFITHTKSVAINDTDFSLWINHKLGLVITAQNDYIKIKELLAKLSKLASEYDKNTQELLPELTQTIKDISWHLSEESKRLVADEEKKDPLTKLFNRRFLDSIMLQATTNAQKSGFVYSIAMIDIDNFKNINDIYGHDMGDNVLSYIAGLMDQYIRPSDFAFRFGGEEFLILLSETSADRAQLIIQNIANAMNSVSFLESNDDSFKVTFSAGIAEFDGQPDYEHTIKKADNALYQSKTNGKNRITIA